MKLFGKSENAKKLASARSDLATAQAALSAINAKENDALGTDSAFSAWRDDRAAAVVKVDRLERLIAALIAGGEVQAKFEAEEALNKRIEAARKNNAEVANRIKSEGPRLAAQLLSLARDAARSQIETGMINRELPPGVLPLRDANFLARTMPTVAREDIAEKVLSMWVRKSNGTLIGDQSDVISEDDKSGYIELNRSTRIDCVRRRFRKIDYHPEIVQSVPENFHQFIRLPVFDLPGIGFDGSVLIEEAVAAIDPDALVAPERKQSNRYVQTELVPAEDWPAPDTNADDTIAGANRN
jgi:hypothetical protein